MTAGAGEPRPTREALARLAAAVQVLRQSRLPEMPGSARAVADLGAAERAPNEPGQAHLDEARATIAAGVGDLDRVPDRQMREAPWLLWTATAPLAGLPGLLDRVEAMAGTRGSVRRKLIEAWLLGFAPDAPRIEEGGRMIGRLLAASPDARLDLWREADRTLALFDARFGPARVAAALLTSPQSVEAVLRLAGLDDPARAGGGYARAVQSEVLAQFDEALRGRQPDEVFSRCAAFLAPQFTESGSRLRFDDSESRGMLARGLLAPWLDVSDPVVDVLRAPIQAFLLKHLNDPRLQPQRWDAAGDAAIRLMRRWLGQASFKAFFELIDELASDHQWRYRQAFWSAYLKEEHVDDIWLALGSVLHANARSIKDLNGAYAKLSGSNQAVLLFRIKHLVFCEWSNVGKVRAWPAGSKPAPVLHRMSYADWELKTPSLQFEGAADRLHSSAGLSHFGAAQWSWQSKAARFISSQTGIRLMNLHDWMPR